MEISRGQNKKMKPQKNTGGNWYPLKKNCKFEDIKQENLVISKFITSISDKKLREKLIRKKILSPKTTMNLVTQDSYGKRHKQSTIFTVLAKEKKKTETNTVNGNTAKPKRKKTTYGHLQKYAAATPKTQKQKE